MGSGSPQLFNFAERSRDYEHRWKSRKTEFGAKDLKSLGPFASVYPLDEAMADLTVTTAADTDVDSFVTPKESYVSLW